MQKLQSLGLLTVAALLAAAVVAPTVVSTVASTPAGAAPKGPPATGPLTVAVEGPLTGTQASTGTDMVRGGQLAVARLNARGGVLGRQVKIVAVDDAAKPAKGPAAARKAIAKRAAAVVGPFNSAVGVTALPVYRAAGLSILRMTSATNTEGFGITTQPMVTQIAPVEATAIAHTMGAHSVDVLYDPSTYTAGIASQLVGLLQGDGLTVPVDQSVSPTAAATVATAVAAVTASPADVVYLAMYGPQAGAVAKALYTQHVAGRCFVDLAAQGPSFVQAAGTGPASACLNSGVPSATELPGGAAYVAAYRAKFHKAPGTWGAFVYDSVNIWAAAVTHTHQPYGAKVRAALAATTGFEGITGVTTAEPKTGNRENPPVVILDISETGRYKVDPTWASANGYQTS
ncbi:MAG TPA: branched-chain amino acid ABC transporter substrate-binding protein [Acidimicrobiales bacterium]|nr:branched-chain amino acid ABC transporter substrate-binding protein [Acidimicrobiales bacterium]